MAAFLENWQTLLWFIGIPLLFIVIVWWVMQFSHLLSGGADLSARRNGVKVSCHYFVNLHRGSLLDTKRSKVIANDSHDDAHDHRNRAIAQAK